MTSTLDQMPAAATRAPADRAPEHRRRTLWVAGAAAVSLVSATIGAALIPVPYLTLRPGSTIPVTELVLVEGAESYPPEHSIAFTTVSIGEATLLEALGGWLDDDVDVLPERRVRGDRSRDENRRVNAQLMDTSKDVAVTVALRQLGMTVDVHVAGTIVRQIVEGSPAEAVLRADDAILAVDAQPVDEQGELGPLLQAGGPGATHTLTVERPAGTTPAIEVPVATVAAPDDPARAIVGVVTEDRLAGFDFPVAVTIDSGPIGGPSAGLAFTLAVLDVLTPGELTGGHPIAVTGTIQLDGTVGPVGGAAQKAVSVRDAGYEAFLVPDDELEEVKLAVGDDLRVIGVGTLIEALTALETLGGNAGPLLGATGVGGT